MDGSICRCAHDRSWRRKALAQMHHVERCSTNVAADVLHIDAKVLDSALGLALYALKLAPHQGSCPTADEPFSRDCAPKPQRSRYNRCFRTSRAGGHSGSENPADSRTEARACAASALAIRVGDALDATSVWAAGWVAVCFVRILAAGRIGAGPIDIARIQHRSVRAAAGSLLFRAASHPGPHHGRGVIGHWNDRAQ